MPRIDLNGVKKDKKDTTITVRISTLEKQRFAKIAKQGGHTESSYLRLLVIKAITDHSPGRKKKMQEEGDGGGQS